LARYLARLDFQVWNGIAMMRSVTATTLILLALVKWAPVVAEIAVNFPDK
jgi:hypothetical protein